MKTNPAVIAALAALAVLVSVESASLTNRATRALRPAVVQMMPVRADELGTAVQSAARAATEWMVRRMKS